MAQASLTPEDHENTLRLLEEHRGNASAAGKAAGFSRTTFQHRVQCAQLYLERKAREGHAPGHFDSGTAPGFFMGKVTIQRGPAGDVERTWERQSPEDHEAALRAAVAALSDEIPRALPVPPPAATAPHLLNLFTLTDSHVGMLAWHREGGEDWDLSIAEQTLVDCFAAMIAATPWADTAIVNQLGDFLHFDGLEAVTPTSRNLLDGDGRFEKVVEVAVRVLRAVVDMALAKHSRVHVIMAEGNHDIAGSVWLRVLFAALYENEPRVTVERSPLPYYAFQHGKTMLAFHHGHLTKNDKLPLLFAAQFPEIWGTTTHRIAHTGHRHHVEEKEHSGMTVIQHPTLAARDAYAARGGWVAGRSATAITYHSVYGQVARNTVTPEMLS